MYGISKDNEVAGKGGNYMAAGIQENVELTSIELAESNSQSVLDFNFENEAGELFRHRVFPVDEAMAKKYAKENLTNAKMSFNETPPAFAKRKARLMEEMQNAVPLAYKKAGDIMLHILSTFVDKDTLIAALSSGINSFEDYGKKIIATMGDSFKGQKVRIKVTLNKKDYPQFPKNVIDPFIQRMEETNKLSITKYDKVVKAQPTPESEYGDNTTDEEAGSYTTTELDDVFPTTDEPTYAEAAPKAEAAPVAAIAETDEW